MKIDSSGIADKLAKTAGKMPMGPEDEGDEAPEGDEGSGGEEGKKAAAEDILKAINDDDPSELAKALEDFWELCEEDEGDEGK